MKIFNHSPGLVRSLLRGEAFAAFIASRVLIFVIVTLATQIRLIPIAGWEGTIYHGLIELSLPALRHSVALKLLAADATWYIGIAQGGYSAAPADLHQPQNWVFFPLLPLLLRFLTTITGSYLISGVIISNLALLGALILLERITRELGYSEVTAKRAVWLMSLWPMSFCFSAPLTESLFSFLLLSSISLLLRGRVLASGAIFGLLTACRPTGFLMLPGFALALYKRGEVPAARRLLALSLAPLGFLSFVLFLYFRTGDPFLFAHNQHYWGRNNSFLDLLSDLIAHPRRIMVAWDFLLLNILVASTALWASARLFKQRHAELALLVAIPVLVALSTGTVQSITRFTLVFFPMYIALAECIRSERRERIAFILLAALLAGMTVMWSLSITGAMA